MSFDIGALRTALKTKIAAAYVAADFDCNVYDYGPMSPTGRSVLIELPAGADVVQYHQTFGTSGVAGLTLEIEARIPAGSARDIDAMKEADAMLGVGTTGSMFDAVSANNYALTGVSGWAVVLESATGPELRGDVDGQRFWYSIRWRCALARSKA